MPPPNKAAQSSPTTLPCWPRSTKITGYVSDYRQWAVRSDRDGEEPKQLLENDRHASLSTNVPLNSTVETMAPSCGSIDHQQCGGFPQEKPQQLLQNRNIRRFIWVNVHCSPCTTACGPGTRSHCQCLETAVFLMPPVWCTCNDPRPE